MYLCSTMFSLVVNLEPVRNIATIMIWISIQTILKAQDWMGNKMKFGSEESLTLMSCLLIRPVMAFPHRHYPSKAIGLDCSAGTHHDARQRHPHQQHQS
jgi:hypothetical protein